MDLVSLFAPLLAISILIERILEAVFSVVETSGGVKAWKETESEQYGKLKQVIAIVAAILIGLVISNALGIGMFARFQISGIDVNADRTLTGAIAGAAAPYSHQIIETLFNLQKLLETKKEEIASGIKTPAEGSL